jgi:pimeloyl-ACP methyl ester carboxylesterase
MTSPITGMFMRPFIQRQNTKKLAITTPNGIREETFITIGGIQQWVTIRGHDRSNPVLVILHGGPASPYTPFNSWLSEWEKHFTIVQWDQRGTGKTYTKNSEQDSDPLSFQKIADDGTELVEYVRKHLSKEKVILLGSSVGSFIGLIMIRQHPDLFYAYVGAEQNSPDGIAASHTLTVDAVRQAGNKRGLATLEAMGTDKSNWTYKQFLFMNKLAINVTRNVPHMIHDLMLPALLFAPDYKMNDIKAIEKSMNIAANQLFIEMRDFDFEAIGYEFDVPFFVFQGEGDIITPVHTAKAYINRIHAPRKAFVTIAHAGHLAEFCNPQQFLDELLDHVLPCAD